MWKIDTSKLLTECQKAQLPSWENGFWKSNVSIPVEVSCILIGRIYNRLKGKVHSTTSKQQTHGLQWTFLHRAGSPLQCWKCERIIKRRNEKKKVFFYFPSFCGVYLWICSEGSSDSSLDHPSTTIEWSFLPSSCPVSWLVAQTLS